jgi:hypothetical protein
VAERGGAGAKKSRSPHGGRGLKLAERGGAGAKKKTLRLQHGVGSSVYPGEAATPLPCQGLAEQQMQATE